MKSKMNRYLHLGASSAALFALSCAPKDPRWVAPTPAAAPAKAQASPGERINPKLDILFVIDNAEAMNKHQDNLSNNIDKFADVFKADASGGGGIDFHIGVTSLFDRTRWVKGKPDCDFDDGQLRPLKHMIKKDPNSNQLSEEILDGKQAGQPMRNYVSNQDTDVAGFLKDTLKLGEQPFHKCGYKFEEEFGPVQAALSPPMLTGANLGFYRPDAHLAVIILSDADDETQDMTADQMKQVLLDAKGGNLNRISVVAVTTSADASDTSCPRDADGPPVKLHELVDKTQGQYLNLCDASFGEKLGKIASTIRQKALTHIIPLKVTPDINTIVVHFGSQIVAPGDAGWTYDQNSKSILINGEFELQGDPSLKISVDYVGINMQNAFDGDRVHVEGQ